MPRSAPTVDGTSMTFVSASMRMIDASGDKRSVTVKGDSANMTDANIEALVAAVAAVTRADIYSVEVTYGYAGNASVGNATTGDKSSSVYDNVVIGARHPSRPSLNVFIPAPISDVFVTGANGPTDTVDTADPLIAAIATAFGDVLDSSYSVSTARYTERSEINTIQSF